MSIKKYVKTAEAIAKMRIAGRLAAEVLEMIEPHVQPGISTGKLNDLCHDFIVNTQKAYPAPLNYRGFPKSVCTSVNHIVCHGIPGEKILKNGDIINIDITVIKDEYHGDTSKTFFVGKPSIKAKRLVEVTRECMFIGISMVKPGVNFRDIGRKIQQYAQAHNFSSVRDFCGHGIGTKFHEPGFDVLHFDTKHIEDTFIEEGHTFTIEPMLNFGKRHTSILRDGWTAVTKDKSLSAQWEHTILTTKTGAEILTLRKEEMEYAKRFLG